MGKLFLVQLDGRVYSCRICKTHLASIHQLLSKDFYCKNGKGYLFNEVVNIYEGPLEERMMQTGSYIVADILCNCCQQVVGWKYDMAREETETYKEGKSILERTKIIGGGCADLYLESAPIISVPITEFR